MIRPCPKGVVQWQRQTTARTLKSGVTVNVFEGSAAMIDDLGEQHMAATLRGAWRAAEQMEVYARTNAPWTDRTTKARRGLRGYAGASPLRRDCWCAAIQHGEDVHYGVWLENRWNGRYAIIGPTQQAFTHRVGEIVADAVRGVV